MWLKIFLLATAAIQLFIIWNLTRKFEKQEEIIDKQDTFISTLQENIQFASNRLNEIDTKGSFKSDDEIGWFFDNVKTIQVMLNEFITNEQKQNGEENKEKKGI